MTNDSPSPRNTVWKFLLPLGIILILVLGGLFFIKTQIAPSLTHQGSQGEIREGSVLSEFSIQQFNGSKVKISDLKAKVLLINFWATWCEACVYEIPSILKLRAALKDKGFEVVFINLDDNPSVVLPRALKRLNIDFPVYLDTDGTLSDLFDVHAIPLTVLMTGDRKVLYLKPGERDWGTREIQEQVEKWLAE